MRSKGCRRPLLSSPGGQEEDGGRRKDLGGGSVHLYRGPGHPQLLHGQFLQERAESQEFGGAPHFLLGKRGGLKQPQFPPG